MTEATVRQHSAERAVYPRVSLYALMLAASGIPLYIHLPRFAATELGIGLATIGSLLLAIRLGSRWSTAFRWRSPRPFFCSSWKTSFSCRDWRGRSSSSSFSPRD
jgi:hypothetical protein